jgi:hypothetical protein
MASEFAMIDRALDKVLVQLGGMVLTLASPQVTRTGAAGSSTVSKPIRNLRRSPDDSRVKELREA